MARRSLQETMDRLLLNVQAGHPVICIVSHEEMRVLDFLARLVRVLLASDPHKNLLCWYEGEGLKRLKGLAPWTGSSGDVDGGPRHNWLQIPGITPKTAWEVANKDNPAQALASIKNQDMQGYPLVADSLTVFFDLHQHLRNDSHTRHPYGSLVRSVRNTAAGSRGYFERNRQMAQGATGFPFKTIVIVTPTAVDFSLELERDLIVIDFPLAEQDELRGALEDMLDAKSLRLPGEISADEARSILDADAPALADDSAGELAGESAQQDEGLRDEYRRKLCELVAAGGRGLTMDAYKLGLNSFSVQHRNLARRHIADMLDLKAQAIKNPALDYTPNVKVELGGLHVITDWIASRRDIARYESVRSEYGLPPLCGVMLCGISGGGKSMLAKHIAAEFNLALLRLDVGALFGSYIGESEQRTRDALRLAEALAPVVLWLDEVEKAFSGIHGGGDNGVSARVFGAFLTWLAEKEDSVFVVATCNDFRVLLDQFPEFGRKGRFDEIFWVNLPDQNARRQIFDIYLRPHFRSGYMQLESEHVDSLAAGQNLPPAESSGDVVQRLSRVLSHPHLSLNMTGAEIQQAIKECAYELYNVPPTERRGLPVGKIIVETVSSAMQRALYRPASPAYGDLLKMRSIAQLNGWPMVGGDAAAPAMMGELDTFHAPMTPIQSF